MIGGAVANVVDRARDGVVTDYLHTGWWPTFNLADTFLVTGFIVIALLHARPERTTTRHGADRTTPPPARSRTLAADVAIAARRPASPQRRRKLG